MKKFILFLFTLISFISLPSNEVKAQVGQTGVGSFDYEYQWLCDSASMTSFYRVYLHRPGFASVVIGTFKPDGTTYSPASTIKAGPCDFAAAPDSTYQYFFDEMCDNLATAPVSFIKIYKYAVKNSSGVGQRSFIGDFSPVTGAAYSAGGSIYTGFCEALAVDAGTKVKVLQVTGSSGSLLLADNGMSVDILNVGTNTARLVINTVNYDLLPGERWFCEDQYDQKTRSVYRCPALTYDANFSGSTTLHISQKGY